MARECTCVSVSARDVCKWMAEGTASECGCECVTRVSPWMCVSTSVCVCVCVCAQRVILRWHTHREFVPQSLDSGSPHCCPSGLRKVRKVTQDLWAQAGTGRGRRGLASVGPHRNQGQNRVAGSLKNCPHSLPLHGPVAFPDLESVSPGS